MLATLRLLSRPLKIFFVVMGLFYLIPITTIIIKLVMQLPFEYVVLDIWFTVLLFLALVVAKIFSSFFRSIPNILGYLITVLVFGIVLFWGCKAIAPNSFEDQSILFFGWHQINANLFSAYGLYLILFIIGICDILFLLIYFSIKRHSTLETKAIKWSIVYSKKLYLTLSILNTFIIFGVLIIKQLTETSQLAIKVDLIVLGCIASLYIFMIPTFAIIVGTKWSEASLLSCFFIPLVFALLGLIFVFVTPFHFIQIRLVYLLLSTMNLISLLIDFYFYRPKRTRCINNTMDIFI